MWARIVEARGWGSNFDPHPPLTVLRGQILTCDDLLSALANENLFQMKMHRLCRKLTNTQTPRLTISCIGNANTDERVVDLFVGVREEDGEGRREREREGEGEGEGERERERERVKGGRRGRQGRGKRSGRDMERGEGGRHDMGSRGRSDQATRLVCLRGLPSIYVYIHTYMYMYTCVYMCVYTYI